MTLKQRSKDWHLFWPCMPPCLSPELCDVRVNTKATLVNCLMAVGGSPPDVKSIFLRTFWESRSSPERGGPWPSCGWANDPNILVKKWQELWAANGKADRARGKGEGEDYLKVTECFPALPMFLKKAKVELRRAALQKELTIDGISSTYPFIHTFTHSVILHSLHSAWGKGSEHYRLWHAELGCWQTEREGLSGGYRKGNRQVQNHIVRGDTMCSSNCGRFREAAIRSGWETGVRCSPDLKGPYT